MKLLPDIETHASSHGPESRPYQLLRRAVAWSLGHRWLVIGSTLFALLLSGLGMGLVQQQFFPTSSRPELFIEVRMPEGTSIAATAAAAKKAEKLIEGDDDAAFYTTYVGQGSVRFFLALNPELPNSKFALVVIMTKGAEARERLKAKLEAAIAAGGVPEARLRIDRLNFGPPVGFPVQFRVIGDDPAKIRAIARRVREIMRTDPNAVDVQFDWEEQAKSTQA